MDKFKTLLVILSVGLVFLGSATAALASQASNDKAVLVHVGLNPSTCETVVGIASGVVVAHSNDQQNRLDLNVAVHSALPNTTYVVNLRCVGQVESLTTNARGTGAIRISLDLTDPMVVTALSNPDGFYVDISVPSGDGAGGFGDTFIAGPFTLP